MTNYLTVTEAAKILGISSSTLNKKRIYGGGPTYCKFGRCIRYPISDLTAWAEASRRSSTSGYIKKGATDV
jgi:excisionase family DNA binding protein